jgi:large subunit ribosomal protein L2
MSLKFYKPQTASLRHLIRCNYENLCKKPLLKNKLSGIKNSSGRNNQGKITSYHRGGGHKKRYRKINLTKKYLFKGIVTSLEYDPNRTSYIISVFDIENANFFYSLAPLNIKIGDLIQYGGNVPIKLGNKLPIGNIPIGCFIHNITFEKKSLIARSAGTFALLLEKTTEHCKIKLSSGEHRLLLPNYYGTIGVVSNLSNSLTTLGKAGRSRWVNKRPNVRGVAMNPIDHPHGGGEGKTSGGRPSVTPWGKPTRNVFTSKSKNIFRIKNKK